MCTIPIGTLGAWKVQACVLSMRPITHADEQAAVAAAAAAAEPAAADEGKAVVK